jgi:hypothetical protein
MKSSNNAAKNICKIALFSGVCKYIRMRGGKIACLSGFSRAAPREIPPKRAVNMAEFPQLYGVPL